MPAPLPEVWLRGPVAGVPPLLQPVAHALLQAREELQALMVGFPDELLWHKPAGMASPGFHLQHLCGVLDRLFTYARGEALSEMQLQALKKEGSYPEGGCTAAALVQEFNGQVNKSLEQLKAEDEALLTQHRAVGRAQLPSTTLGLYMHAAEHTMRHFGQLLVTVNVLRTVESRYPDKEHGSDLI